MLLANLENMEGATRVVVAKGPVALVASQGKVTMRLPLSHKTLASTQNFFLLFFETSERH